MEAREARPGALEPPGTVPPCGKCQGPCLSGMPRHPPPAPKAFFLPVPALQGWPSSAGQVKGGGKVGGVEL